MFCKYFKKCGGCSLPIEDYNKQLELKLNKQKENFFPLYKGDFDIVKSLDGGFRNRAEFRIWKNFDDDKKVKLNYAMNDFDKKILVIDSCSIVTQNISNLMPKLLQQLEDNKVLNFKLFAIEFLSSTTSDMLVTLIYHKKLDQLWEEKAKELQNLFDIKIIGRSRKQKVVLDVDYISEELNIFDRVFKFYYKEGGFTQPNQNVNIKMIEWVLNNINPDGDLCELYCGGGNFTIPLSTKFNKVLATEISKTSIRSAKTNCKLLSSGLFSDRFVRY